MTVEETLNRIAFRKLCITVTHTRNSDRLDFHEVHVANVMEALREAYEAGMRKALVINEASEDPIRTVTETRELPMTETTLRDIQKVSVSDFGGDQVVYDKLMFSQAMARPVTVDCEACDGYYDITLIDGTEVPAVSAYHLVGFTKDSL